MIILGITDGDNGGACVLEDGVLLSAMNEERLNRKRLAVGFPMLSIREVLRLSDVEPSEVDAVAIAGFDEEFHSHTLENKGLFDTDHTFGHHLRNKVASVLSPYLARYALARKLYYQMKVRLSQARKVGNSRLLTELGVDAPIQFYHHHLCHALSAYFTSGFDSALTITLDGGGDGACSHIYTNNGHSLKQLFALDGFNSIGNFYAYVTHICGFTASLHEGKITSLAAHGKPIYKHNFLNLITYDDGKITNNAALYYQPAIRKILRELPANFKREDLAASIQSILEDFVAEYVRYWITRTTAKRVALAGGVFSNVRLNQQIAEIPEVEEVYVFPQMGDGGLAVGAAYAMYAERNASKQVRPHRLEHVYLGSEYTDDEILRELKSVGLPFRQHDNPEHEIARLLADGKVVARFNGRMEYGPMALGNRSILYQATDATVNDWLNKRLGRTEFMPFAPAVLSEYADRCVSLAKAGKDCAKYMALTCESSQWLKERCPGVVHVNGTTRPQVVSREQNPTFYRIIDEYRELTGLPAILNTSFNMHEEPIVCTPADALRSFRQARLDCLAIGKFIVQNANRPSTGERGLPEPS